LGIIPILQYLSARYAEIP